MNLTALEAAAIITVVAGVVFASGPYFIAAGVLWFLQTLFNEYI